MKRYQLERGPDAESVEIMDGLTITLGRAKENQIVLGDNQVSSRHAVVELGPEGPVIRDLESKNGTWLNGERLEEPRVLAPGDDILIGQEHLRLVAKEVPDGPPVTFLEEGSATQQIFASIDSEAARALREANRSLAALHGMGGLLIDVDDEDDLCSKLLDLVFEVLGADRSCVILKDRDGSLSTRLAKARRKERESLDVPSTILNTVVEEETALLTADAAKDSRFQTGKSIIFQGIRAAMCAPLRGKREVLGALYVDTDISTGAFTPDDLELLTTLGIQGGIAIENLQLARANLAAGRLAAVGGVMAGLSHDIRNILGALKAGIFLINKHMAEEEDSGLLQAWDIVRSGTDTISELVEDMVSYSKAREPELVPTDLNGLVTRVAKRFAGAAEEGGTALTTDLDPEVGEVPMDGKSVDRVLTNLLANALDAVGDDGGAVSVTSEVDGDAVVVSVSDDGYGIPPGDLERIFDLLYSTKGSKGTGFGLAVAKKIAEEHGGGMEVESEVGQGARFRLRLPRG